MMDKDESFLRKTEIPELVGTFSWRNNFTPKQVSFKFYCLYVIITSDQDISNMGVVSRYCNMNEMNEEDESSITDTVEIGWRKNYKMKLKMKQEIIIPMKKWSETHSINKRYIRYFRITNRYARGKVTKKLKW